MRRNDKKKVLDTIDYVCTVGTIGCAVVKLVDILLDKVEKTVSNK